MKMNSVHTTTFLILLTFLSSCGNDDDSIIVNELKNQAPGLFDLIGVVDDDTAVGLSPTFSWNEAVDPDGDTVTYDFYLGKGQELPEAIATNLTTKSINQELSFSEEYRWKVIAKDDKGASSESETFSFSTRNLRPFNTLVDQTSFSERRGHALASFQNRLWLFGGESGDLIASGLGEKEKDLWYSDNGINWTKSADQAPFGHRNFNTPIVFNNKMYIIGGLGSKPGSGVSEIADYKNDVWVSNSGNDWAQLQFNAAFSKRFGHSLVVFKDKIWLYGGVDENGNYLNDLYVSDDGNSWNLVTVSLFDVTARAQAKLMVFNDKLYLIGGRNDTLLNEIWESESGNDWALMASGNEVPVNNNFDALIYKDKLVLIDYLNDTKIWYSDDAVTWKSVQETSQFNKRVGSISTFFNDKIYVVGGIEVNANGSFGDALNDVWIIE